MRDRPEDGCYQTRRDPARFLMRPFKRGRKRQQARHPHQFNFNGDRDNRRNSFFPSYSSCTSMLCRLAALILMLAVFAAPGAGAWGPATHLYIAHRIFGPDQPAILYGAMAPDLSVIHQRLRPDYLKRWLANPKQILPYTPMPVNIKYTADAPNLGGVSQSLYHGTSLEQLQGLVDLLMNYPRYAKRRAPVAELVQPGDAATTTTTASESSAP